MHKRYRGHCDLDSAPQAITNMANKARRLSRIETLRAAGLNIPVGENIDGLADWECELLYR